MRQVNIHEAKTHLSKLVDAAAAGEDIILARSGKPIARLTSLQSKPTRVFGVMAGRLRIPSSFDAPLPEDVIRSFEGD